jgi:hypothetical protein
MPYRPHLHQVGGPATQDKKSEQPEHPPEGKIAAAAGKIEQTERNAVVAERNQTVRDDMQPYDPRIPQVTKPVRHEPGSEYVF